RGDAMGVDIIVEDHVWHVEHDRKDEVHLHQPAGQRQHLVLFNRLRWQATLQLRARSRRSRRERFDCAISSCHGVSTSLPTTLAPTGECWLLVAGEGPHAALYARRDREDRDSPL